MSKLAQMQALAAQAAQTGPDMTEAQKGGGGRLLPEGYAFGRLVEYVELGLHPQEFNGQAKDPADEMQLAFALWGQGYQNEDGTPYIIRPFSVAISRNEKAKAFKLFKTLNWRGTCTHFAQLLGEAFLVKIVHGKGKAADAKVTGRVDFDGFLPPLDPVTKSPYPIPEARDEDLRLFLWDYPSKEGWDSLFIEGKYDDGKSKNRIQETIIGALNFAGSPLEILLSSTSGIPALPSAAAAPALPNLPATPAVPAAPVVAQANPPAAAQAAVPLGSPVIPALPATGSTVQSASGATTSPSNLVMPVLPSIPATPVLPQ